MTIDRNVITRRQIAALEKLGLDELRVKFEELYGFCREGVNAQNLRFRIAYRLQELQFGGLSSEAEAVLDTIADEDPLANLKQTRPKYYTYTRGTRYERDWHGHTYVVTVLGRRQFEYENEVYSSLTAIASRITGTHWSGKNFFGVKK